MDRTTLLNESKSVIESISSWKHIKECHTTDLSITTSLYSTIRNNEFWCCRKSIIPGELKHRLLECIIGQPTQGLTHSDHESNYIKEITRIKVDDIQEYHDGWSYKLIADYNFGGILSKRKFYEFQQVYKFDNCAYILSIPIQGESNKEYVIGKYHSIERLSWSNENEKDGIEWIMATTSDAGGNIPKWITKLSVPGAIAKDVPSVLKYIQKHMN